MSQALRFGEGPLPTARAASQLSPTHPQRRRNPNFMKKKLLLRSCVSEEKLEKHLHKGSSSSSVSSDPPWEMGTNLVCPTALGAVEITKLADSTSTHSRAQVL